MQTFTVIGANKETGEDVTIDLEAKDKADAESKAKGLHILISSVTIAADPFELDIELEAERLSEQSHQTATASPSRHCPVCRTSKLPIAVIKRDWVRAIFLLILVFPFGLYYISQMGKYYLCPQCRYKYGKAE